MQSASVQRDLETFKKNIEPFLDQWRSLDIRVVAMREEKEGQSSFQNAATTITLLPTTPHQAKLLGEFPDLGWLKAVHEIRPIEDLKSILFKLAADGTITVKDMEVSLFSSDSSAWFGKNQRGERYTSSPKDWTSYSLVLDSRFAVSMDPRKIDEVLKSTDCPFLSLEELIQEFPLWRGAWGARRGLCQINAVFGIRIVESRWENDKLKIVVERMPSWDFKDVDLGLIYTLKSGSKLRRSHEIEQLTLDKEGRLKVNLRPPGNVYAATVLLRMKRNTIDETAVYHPHVNPRLNVYKVFDENLEKLRSWLSVEGGDSGNFEKAVEILLSLCGYSSLPFIRYFGQKGRIDIRGTDCLVVDPKGNLFIVECTTGPIDTDKLEKLRYRNHLLQNSGYNGISILFTTVPRDSVSKDVMKKAQDDKISLMAREHIEMLLSMVERNAHLDETTDFIYKCIPSSFPSR